MALSSKLLAESALIAFPTVFLCTYLYSKWSTKWALTAFIGLTLLGLLWVLQLETHVGGNPVWPVGLLIIGSNGIIAILLPCASESYPIKIRGRAMDWVAMFTKGGGVLAQSLSILALVPSLGVTAILIMVPVILSLVLFLRYETETRGMDLRHLEAGNRPSSPVATATLAGAEAGLAREAGIGRSA